MVERHVARFRLLIDRGRSGAARRCRARCPGRRDGPDSPRREGLRRRAPRPSPNRCPAPDSIIGLRGCRGSGWIVLCRWKPSGTRAEPRAELSQLGDVDAGAAAARLVDPVGRPQPRPAAVEPIGLVGLIGLRRPRTPSSSSGRHSVFISSTSARVTTPSPISFSA